MAVKTVQKEKIFILRNPITVKQMAMQVRNACDFYISQKLNEKDFRELLHHYAGMHGCKFFGRSEGLNPTLEKIIGKKRKELVEIILCDFQKSLF